MTLINKTYDEANEYLSSNSTENFRLVVLPDIAPQHAEFTPNMYSVVNVNTGVVEYQANTIPACVGYIDFMEKELGISDNESTDTPRLIQ